MALSRSDYDFDYDAWTFSSSRLCCNTLHDNDKDEDGGGDVSPSGLHLT